MLARKLILFAFIVVASLFVQTSAADTLPPAVINYMSTRAKRYHHYLWHYIRNTWNRLSENSKRRITELGWAPPRPARSYDANGRATQILDNNAGEDFLFMHRSMVSRFNSLSTGSNDPYGRLVGWTAIPAPGDANYPVPPAYTVPDDESETNLIRNQKTDNFYTRTIRPLERTFTDPVQLRNMTLGEMGARIEATIHSHMHMRWSNESIYGYRSGGSGVIPNFDRRWDDRQYAWLGDSYSAQLDPVFWKIHGWVDDRIEDWRRANNLTTIRWRGTWIGGPMANLSSVMKMASMSGDDMDMGDEMDDTMPTVAKLIWDECGNVGSSFGDEVFVDDFVPDEFKPPTKTCRVTKKSVL